MPFWVLQGSSYGVKGLAQGQVGQIRVNAGASASPFVREFEPVGRLLFFTLCTTTLHLEVGSVTDYNNTRQYNIRRCELILLNLITIDIFIPCSSNLFASPDCFLLDWNQQGM